MMRWRRGSEERGAGGVTRRRLGAGERGVMGEERRSEDEEERAPMVRWRIISLRNDPNGIVFREKRS